MSNTVKEARKYKAFGGKILYAYKQDRDECIKLINKFRWKSAEERIEFVDWSKLVDAVNGIDVDTEKAMKGVVRSYYDELSKLNEKLYAEIDKIYGLDKVMARLV